MKKFPSLKCPVCSKVYKEVGTFANHMRHEHPGTIPEGWSDLRYAYFVFTGKSEAHCTECGALTEWNETTGKYARLCSNPACKKQFRDRVMAGMRKKYGQVNMLEDPSFRERMLTHRRISGEYQFADGGKVAYMGNLEKAFLKMLDTFFHFPSSDIMSPSPNRYNYYYENENDMEHAGEHMYVPDFFIPSLNLEIELKSSDNQRPRNLLVDVPKDAAKDIAMIKNPMINFCKVYENDYYVFFQIFSDLAEQNITGEHRAVKYISRSLLTSIYRDYIPNSCLKILDQYIYKYSEKDILKKPATEAEGPMLEEIQTTVIEREDDIPHFSPDDVYQVKTEEENEDEDSTGNDEIGINPMLYYQIGKYSNEDAASNANESFSFFSLSNGDLQPGFESVFDYVDQDTIDGRAAKRYGRWRDRLFGNRLFGKAAAGAFVKVDVSNGRITIKGVNCNLLLYRIKEHYAESKLKYIFEYQYNARSWKLYQKKKIGRGDMKIDFVYAPEFFALELIDLFRELADAYRDQSYQKIAQLIYDASWLSKADTHEVAELDTTPLKNIRLDLLEHQVNFIKKWPILLNYLNLHGYILSFKPGQGKTLTSIGLAECLGAKHVYIICPNNLKDNWALEIKKYYAKYDDETTWMHDVCILGTKYGDPKTARFIITNNESIPLMTKIAEKDENSLFILDESHNFRNYEGIRSKQLFEVANKIQSKNILCLSATPIKAVPAEIVPAMKLIDITFTDEAAAMYTRCFDLSTTAAMGLVTKRFGMTIYNPDNIEVQLPPYHLEFIPLKVDDWERYTLLNVHGEIINLFKELHKDFIESHQAIIDSFTKMIRKYSLAPKKITDEYLFWVINSMSSMKEQAHELAVKEYRAYLETYIRPNAECPSSIMDTLIEMEAELTTAARSSMGTAVGRILPKRRAEMFKQLYLQNREYFYEKIRANTKKTIFFTTMVDVAKTISNDLTQFGIGNTLVTGGVSDRLSAISRFREDPNTLVLVATSQTMGTGMTFIEASQLFFFGTPWRSTDFEQAWKRIYRIGQNVETYIFTVRLDTPGSPNLSDRMQDILDWSSNMFSAAILPTDLDGETINGVATEMFGSTIDPAMEYAKSVPNLIAMLSNLGDVISTFKHGIVTEDGLQKFDGLNFNGFKSLTPGRFYKEKAGTFFDFQLFEDYYIKSHSYTAFSYLIEVTEPVHKMHAIATVYDGNWILYPEFYLGSEDSTFTDGVYAAKTLDEICSFVANSLTHNNPNTKMKVYRIKAKYGWCDEEYADLMARIYKEPVRVKYIREATDLEFAVQALLPDLEEANEEYIFGSGKLEMDRLNNLSSYFYSIAINNVNILSSRDDDHNLDIKYRAIAEDKSIFSGKTSSYFNDFALASDLVKKLNQIFNNQIATFCIFIESPYGSFIHPMVFVPFRDHFIYIEAAFNGKENDMYVVDNPKTAIQTLALNTVYAAALRNDLKYEDFDNIIANAVKDGTFTMTAYPLDGQFWKNCDFISRKDIIDILKASHVNPISISYDKTIRNEYGSEIRHLPRLEVYNRGWRICRF